MNFNDFLISWNNYFHNLEPLISLSLVRFVTGICLLITFIQCWGNKKFFTKDGFYSTKFREGTDFMYANFLDKISKIDFAFLIGCIFSIFLSIGFLTQLSCLFLMVLWNATLSRNHYVFHGGHSTISVVLFLMLFSHADTYFSIDSLIGVSCFFPSYVCFSQLLKIQISFVLMCAYLGKVFNSHNIYSWIDGSVLYYSLNHPTYSRHFFRKLGIFKKENIKKIDMLAHLILFLQLIVGTSLFFPQLWFVSFLSLFLMQLGFVVFLRLGVFPWMYMGLSLLFIPNEVFEKYLGFLF